MRLRWFGPVMKRDEGYIGGRFISKDGATR